MTKKINVTIWNEFRHEKEREGVKKIYPDGIHNAIARGIAADDLSIRTATLDEPEHGLTEEVVENTDVMLWWGHCHHKDVADEVVKRVQRRVLEGMGLIVLHSGHYSKIFKALTGTTCSLKWREVAEKERLWNVAPSHPITQGVGEYFELPNEEMYGEPFGIPEPDELIFIGWFEGGEVFRSGAVFRRGNGKLFYFQPGHETYPVYYNENVLKVIGNAVRWANPLVRIKDGAPNVQPLEKISPKNVNFDKAGVLQTPEL